MQQIGIPFNSPLIISPISSKELTIFGKHFWFIFPVYNSYFSHKPVDIFNKWVLLALEESVTYLPVSKKAIQVSIVPNLTVPYFTFSGKP